MVFDGVWHLFSTLPGFPLLGEFVSWAWRAVGRKHWSCWPNCLRDVAMQAKWWAEKSWETYSVGEQKNGVLLILLLCICSDIESCWWFRDSFSMDSLSSHWQFYEVRFYHRCGDLHRNHVDLCEASSVAGNFKTLSGRSIDAGWASYWEFLAKLDVMQFLQNLTDVGDVS